jgi:hypothetical protein
MHIYCSQCGQKFDSLIIDQVQALQEITNALVRHCQHKHNELFGKLNQAVMKVSFAVGGYLTLTELGTVPKEQDYIVRKLVECQEIMMAAVGFNKMEEGTTETSSETSTNIIN